MKILINDFMQNSNAPEKLISPVLWDFYSETSSIPVTLEEEKTINCIGIGYTDATTITITDGVSYTENITYDEKRLYVIPTLTAQSITISHDGTYIGRVALGVYRSLGVAPTRETGFFSTNENILGLTGGIIPGAGGVNGNRIAIDFRYKIDEDIYTDFQAAKEYVLKSYPYFMLFDKETHRIPYTGFYGSEDVSQTDLLFQSSVNRFLYSRQFDFYERF